MFLPRDLAYARKSYRYEPSQGLFPVDEPNRADRNWKKTERCRQFRHITAPNAYATLALTIQGCVPGALAVSAASSKVVSRALNLVRDSTLEGDFLNMNNVGVKSHLLNRFGNGIYSSPNPALADEFATSSTSSPYRVMIACEVYMPLKATQSPRGVEAVCFDSYLTND